eukprot:1140070-Pelagomonas_calceolata.AAC.1
MQQIRYLEAQGKAFTLSDHETSSQHGHKEPPLSGYVLAGVVFQKGSDNGGTQLEDNACWRPFALPCLLVSALNARGLVLADVLSPQSLGLQALLCLPPNAIWKVLGGS